MWQGIDRRRFPRASYKCMVTVRQKGSTKTFRTQTENLGAGGVCVVLDRRLEIFSNTDLIITLENGTPPVKCMGTVVWTVKRRDPKKTKPQLYDIGIEFANIVPEDRVKIDKLVESLIEKSL